MEMIAVAINNGHQKMVQITKYYRYTKITTVFVTNTVVDTVCQNHRILAWRNIYISIFKIYIHFIAPSSNLDSRNLSELQNT